MKTLFILVSLIIVLFLAAPEKVEAQKLTVAMKKQLASALIESAEELRGCIGEAGLDRIVNIKALSLNSGGKQYLITGKADGYDCSYGARSPMHWIFERRDGEFRMLADIGACDRVQVTTRRTNGYFDIKIGSYYIARPRFSSAIYKYDGTTYKCPTCGHD